MAWLASIGSPINEESFLCNIQQMLLTHRYLRSSTYSDYVEQGKYIDFENYFFFLNSRCCPSVVHLLLFITRKYTSINANLKLINSKIHSFYLIDIH